MSGHSDSEILELKNRRRAPRGNDGCNVRTAERKDLQTLMGGTVGAEQSKAIDQRRRSDGVRLKREAVALQKYWGRDLSVGINEMKKKMSRKKKKKKKNWFHWFGSRATRGKSQIPWPEFLKKMLE